MKYVKFVETPIGVVIKRFVIEIQLGTSIMPVIIYTTGAKVSTFITYFILVDSKNTLMETSACVQHHTCHNTIDLSYRGVCDC